MLNIKKCGYFKGGGKNKNNIIIESNFFNSVYQIVSQIPYGRVTSYGAIAVALGAKKSARIVGYALNESHKKIPDLPAHRVVNRSGLLTGKIHFGTHNKMEELLTQEGVIVKNNKIENFESIFWNPLTELT